MSIDAINWAIKNQSISPTQKLVLIVLANRSDEHGKCWPSLSSLMKDTCLGKTALVTALNVLCEYGLVERKAIGSAINHKTTEYEVKFFIDNQKIVQETNQFVKQTSSPDELVCDANKASSLNELGLVRQTNKASSPDEHQPSLNHHIEPKENQNSIPENLPAPIPPKAKEKPEKKSRLPAIPKQTFGEFQNVKLTETEYGKLCSEYGEEFTKACVEFLSAYREEKGYKTKNDNLTIRRWVVDAVRKKQGQTHGNQFYAGQPPCNSEWQLMQQEERMRAGLLLENMRNNGNTYKQRKAKEISQNLSKEDLLALVEGRE